MKKVKEIKKWIELYNEMHTACEELQLTYDFYKEELSTEQEVDQSLLLTDHYLSYGKLRAIGRNIKNNQQVDLNYYFMPTWKRLFWNFLKPLGMTDHFKAFFTVTKAPRINDE